MTDDQLIAAAPSGNLTCQGNACADIQTETGNTGVPYNLPYDSFKNIGKKPVTIGIKSPLCSSESKLHKLNPGESWNQSGGLCSSFTANH
jgi:hypothetical protein